MARSRRGPELNRCARFCRPLPNHSATPPKLGSDPDTTSLRIGGHRHRRPMRSQELVGSRSRSGPVGAAPLAPPQSAHAGDHIEQASTARLPSTRPLNWGLHHASRGVRLLLQPTAYGSLPGFGDSAKLLFPPGPHALGRFLLGRHVLWSVAVQIPLSSTPSRHAPAFLSYVRPTGRTVDPELRYPPSPEGNRPPGRNTNGASARLPKAQGCSSLCREAAR